MMVIIITSKNAKAIFTFKVWHIKPITISIVHKHCSFFMLFRVFNKSRHSCSSNQLYIPNFVPTKIFSLFSFHFFQR